MDLCTLVFMLCLAWNKPQWTWFLCANVIFPYHHLIRCPCLGKFYWIPLYNTLLITTTRSKVHMNLIGEWSNYPKLSYPCMWFIFSWQIIHGYRKHVTVISFDFFPSLLICYHSSLPTHMIAFPKIPTPGIITFFQSTSILISLHTILHQNSLRSQYSR